MIDRDKYRGCFTGLAVGDALGAGYEGGVLERMLWRLIGKTRNRKHRYTDDTQMSIALASSLLSNNGVHQEHLANSFAQSYRWSRGFGPGTAWILKKIKKGADWKTVHRGKFKQGSFGNGAAMRAPVLGMYFISDHDTLIRNVKLVSEITHPHPLAIEGANLIALATSAALNNNGNNEILHLLQDWCHLDEFKNLLFICFELLRREEIVDVQKLRKSLGNGFTARESTVTALFLALKYRKDSLPEMLQYAQKLGGDTDTISAMCGAIWGAFNGLSAMDPVVVKGIEDAEKISQISDQLHTAASVK